MELALEEEFVDYCVNNEVELLRRLLHKNRNKVDTFIETAAQYSILHELVYRDYHQIIIELLTIGVNPNIQNKNGESPLHWATRKNRYECVNILLNHGADVHLKDNSGSTALHYACSLGIPEIIPLLLAKGGNLDEGDKDGISPIDIVTTSNDAPHLACATIIKRHAKKHKKHSNIVPTFLKVLSSPNFSQKVKVHPMSTTSPKPFIAGILDVPSTFDSPKKLLKSKSAKSLTFPGHVATINNGKSSPAASKGIVLEEEVVNFPQFLPSCADIYDVMINIEQCWNCQEHFSVRHDHGKYLESSCACLEAIAKQLWHSYSRLNIYGLITKCADKSRIGALEIVVSIKLSEPTDNVDMNHVNLKSTIESNNHKNHWKSKKLFSKLQSRSWPSIHQVSAQAVKFVKETLEESQYSSPQATEILKYVNQDEEITRKADLSITLWSDRLREYQEKHPQDWFEFVMKHATLDSTRSWRQITSSTIQAYSNNIRNEQMSSLPSTADTDAERNLQLQRSNPPGQHVLELDTQPDASN